MKSRLEARTAFVQHRFILRLWIVAGGITPEDLGKQLSNFGLPETQHERGVGRRTREAHFAEIKTPMLKFKFSCHWYRRDFESCA